MTTNWSAASVTASTLALSSACAAPQPKARTNKQGGDEQGATHEILLQLVGRRSTGDAADYTPETGPRQP